MAIAFRAAATSLDFGSTRSNSTLTAPGTRVSGDLLIGVVELINTTAPAALSTPSGWTLLGSRAWGPSQSAYGQMYVYSRTADGTSADNLVTSHATMYSQAEMVAYSGVHATSPFDIAIQFANGNTTTSGASVNATSATTLTNGATVVTIRHGWDGTAITPTSGWTERVDHAAGHIQDRLYATPASTGAISIPSGNTAGTKPWVTATIVLRDAAAGDPPPYAPSWMDAVAAAAAGTGQARAMFLGDSFTEGEGPGARADRWMDKVITGLRTAASISGSGLGHTPPRYNTYLADSSSWRSPATASPTIANKVFARAASGYFQWTITGTAYTVLYNGGSGFGPLSVSTDGGAAETITAASSGRALRWDKTGLSSGSHTVRVTAGTGGGQVVGIIAYNGDTPTTGLTYLDWSWTGATSAQFAASGAYDPTGIQFAPHLVIDGQNGANDHLNDIDTGGSTPAPTPATVASRFSARVAEYRSWPSSPLVALFVLPTMPTGSAVNESQTNSLGYTLNDYRNAMVTAANALDVPVLDCRTLVTLTLGDLASDNLHIKAAGHQAVADGIISSLIALSVPGSVASTVPKVTASISGNSIDPASLSTATPKTTAAITGTSRNPATMSVQSPKVTASATGAQVNAGSMSGATPKVTASVAGSQVNAGSFAASVPRVTTLMVDQAVVNGVIVGTLPKVTGSLSGGSTNPGSMSAGLPKVTASAAGQSVNGGSMSAQAPKVTASLVDTSVVAGVLAITLPKITGVLTGQSVNAGSMAASIPRVTAAIAGAGSAPVALVAVLPRVIAALVGTQVNTGSMTATLPAVTGLTSDAIDPGHDTNVVAIVERPTRTITVLERPTRTHVIKEAT